LVVFSGRTARVVLQPTSSVDLAEHRLQRLAVGGTTPLTHGIVAGLRLIRTERLRDASVYPLLVLISDGRGNISLFGEEPLVEAQRLAEQLAAENIHTLVIDSARDHSVRAGLPRIGTHHRTPLFGGYGFNACLDLAERAGGEYLGLYDLSQGAIVEGVEKSLRGRRMNPSFNATSAARVPRWAKFCPGAGGRCGSWSCPSTHPRTAWLAPSTSRLPSSEAKRSSNRVCSPRRIATSCTSMRSTC